MRLITWNINSVRARLEHLGRLAALYAPDVICLQETKAREEDFPADAVRQMGYPHLLLRGMKAYNGVAILSRLPLQPAESRDWTGRRDCRHLAARLPGGIELHNFYVPAGGDVPDPAENDKFAHKLDFLEEMIRWFPENRDARAPMLLVGDLNIAPLESDVWSSRQLAKVVSHTPVEREILQRALDSFGWRDAMRHAIPEPGRLYTWWSYRARDWRKADRGRRLDHIWATPPLLPSLRDMQVLEEVRGWDTPSDHAPVLAVFG